MKTLLLLLLSALCLTTLAESKLPLVEDLEWQPFNAQVSRVIEALSYQGAPLATQDKSALEKLSGPDAATKAQEILDRYCLLAVDITPESRVKVAQGPAKAVLAEQGWKTFLVKVHNEAGVTTELRAVSPNAQSAFSGGAYRNPSDKEFKNGQDDKISKSPPLDGFTDVRTINPSKKI